MGAISKENSPQDDSQIVAQAENALNDIAKIKNEIGQIIFGQETVVEQVVLTILSGGHVLLVGVPGLAKTKLVATLSTVLGLQGGRVQFTPDLMPSDILGSEVMEENKDRERSFRFIKGPIFSELLMADEINRASPRTQSALLQAMQEYHITVAGKEYPLPKPFHVLATQNPLEQEGTYPLPEAQLDRFLMQVDVLYPDVDAERKILLYTTKENEKQPVKILNAARLIEIQNLIRKMPVSDSVVTAILDLVRSARPGLENKTAEKFISWGPGPRAGQAMMLCVRARALYNGRLAPSIDDVYALAEPILQHRMALKFSARAEGMTMRKVISQLVGEQRK